MFKKKKKKKNLDLLTPPSLSSISLSQSQTPSNSPSLSLSQLFPSAACCPRTLLLGATVLEVLPSPLSLSRHSQEFLVKVFDFGCSLQCFVPGLLCILFSMILFYLLWVFFSFFIWVFCDLKWNIFERKIENFFVVDCFLSFFYRNIWVFQ